MMRGVFEMSVSKGRLAVPRALEDSVQALMAHLGELANSVSWDSSATATINAARDSQVLLQVGHTGKLKNTVYFVGSDEKVLGSLSDYARQHRLTVLSIPRRESQVDAVLSPKERYDGESVFAEVGVIVNERR